MSYRSIGLALSLSLHAFIAAGIYQWQQQEDEPEVSSQASKAVKLSMAMFQEKPLAAQQAEPVEKETTDAKAVVLKNSAKSAAPKPIETPKPIPKPKPKPKPKPIEPISPTPPPAAKPAPKKKVVKPASAKTVIVAEPAVITAPAVQGSTANTAQKAQADAARQGVEDAYKNAVRVAILKHRKYPRQARRKRREGTVRIAFQLSRDGAISNLRVVQSSGIEQLDKAALNAVRKVQRFPAIPTAVRRELWQFELPVSFKLAT